MAGFNQQTCGDDYTPNATIEGVWTSVGGWFLVTGAGVFVEMQYGTPANPIWLDEQGPLGAGANGSVTAAATGLRFRNAVAGVPAIVSAAIGSGSPRPTNYNYELQPVLNISSVGEIAVSNPPGTLLSVTPLISGTSFTTGTGTNQLRARLVGGGGAGGSASGGQAASGGGAGAYVDTGLIAATPATAYAYTIGAGGVVPGGVGGNTTLTVGTETFTAGGGSGGASGAAYNMGGAGGLPSGGINGSVDGEQGGGSDTFNAGTYAIGGGGGSIQPYGSGGPGALGTGPQLPGAAVGFGSGGGGSVQGAAGGAGMPGYIVIEEYA